MKLLNDNEQNIIINAIMPLIEEICNGTNQCNLLKDFKKDTGSNDYNTLLKISSTYENLMRCMKNFKELNKKSYMALNTVVPHRWEQRYKTYVVQNMIKQFEIDPSKEFEARRLSNELDRLVKDNPDIYSYYVYKQQHNLSDMLLDDINVLSEEYAEKLSDEEIEKMTEKILITDTNVKFYHGTSYENHLKIIKDGYIKATNYLDAKYPNKKIKRLYEAETGYIFVMDSLDIPLAFSFGGYRKNAIPWAYDNEDEYDLKNEDKNDIHNIGVVYEIDPTKYELYFYRKENEFIIKGNIPIDDVNTLFFKINDDTGNISQITEEDLRKDGIIN